jgi:hypothetical protein
VRLWPGLIFAYSLMAQEIAPIGIVRGALVECNATQLIARTADSHIYLFILDGKTFIERDSYRISCAKIDKGEALEIVSDRLADSSQRYARMVTVVNPEIRARRAMMAARAPLLTEDPTLSIAPRGALTFTGVVLRMDDDGLVLRTRVNGEKWILVRGDTRFREDGLRVEPSSLHSNTRVFVRAGKNLDGEVEAYEIVWGEILVPAGSR